jgi:cytidine deaminase
MVKYTELLQHAAKALENSYAPYSRFRVGAALLTEDGQVFTGCNVENASYGLSNCAERTAVFKAVSNGKKSFRAIAIVSDRMNPVYPCGACRQVLMEFNPRIKIVLRSKKGRPLVRSLRSILPYSFGPENLFTKNK